MRYAHISIQIIHDFSLNLPGMTHELKTSSVVAHFLSQEVDRKVMVRTVTTATQTGGSFWCQGSAMSSDLFFACFSHPKYEPEYPELVFMKSWRVFGLMINGIICSGFRHCGIQGSSWPGEECDSECSIPRERLLQHRWSVSGPSSLGIRTEKISEETPGAVWNAWAESHVVSIELLKKKV